jgi:hypothetical protein
MVALDFFIDVSLLAALLTACNINMYQEYVLGGRGEGAKAAGA